MNHFAQLQYLQAGFLNIHEIHFIAVFTNPLIYQGCCRSPSTCIPLHITILLNAMYINHVTVNQE
jgi:hypothetical protein